MLHPGSAAAYVAALTSSLASKCRPRLSDSQLINLSSFNSLRHQASPLLTFQARGFAATTASEAVMKTKSRAQEVRAWLKIFKQLSKARLSALVVSTTTVGYIAGSEERVNWMQLGWTAAGTFGAAACANTLNQVYEMANDARMKRTMMRPLPLGRISKLQALAFAGLMGVGGTVILAQKANLLTAGLGAANILLYAGVYTPLKVVSVANTWVGAVVGGIPPLMGWTAAAGCLEPGAAVLALALYFWQLPHFLSLAWLCKDDYMRGGYAMLPRFDPLGRRTAACALRNSLYMLPLGALAVWVGTATMAFAYEATIAAGTLATTAAVFYQKPSQRSARLLFRFSILFLPVFMLGLAIHRVPNSHTVSFDSLRVKLSQGSSLGGPGMDSELKAAWPLQEISAVPLPFLPVPLQMRCPAKASCQGKAAEDK